ncbi:hypothetical protein CANINC_000241 [Pichia inconspicua]|uniref:G domain-containing protein n=1 Tax=Pichia inconspicua TaxID=52247 RepID=A0A4T0X737_9ASCO|nr:hypothetical protein CANINC_000241 [[Candida] inconspicua]
MSTLGFVAKRPIRIAILGPHKTGKSQFISEIATGKTLDAYYPTMKNSTFLLNVGSKSVEIIDTPGVCSEELIPFLERSLDNRLAKDILGGLANNYNTKFRSKMTPILVASGASELNGEVDGYLLFYSAVPSELPPSYEEQENSEDELRIIEDLYECIQEAWKDFSKYKKGWIEGKEYDEMSLSASIKQLWSKEKEKGTFVNILTPPIILVCTNSKSDRAAPLLVQKGKQLAKKWNCQFVEKDESSALGLLHLAVAESRAHEAKNIK